MDYFKKFFLKILVQLLLNRLLLVICVCSTLLLLVTGKCCNLKRPVYCLQSINLQSFNWSLIVLRLNHIIQFRTTRTPPSTAHSQHGQKAELEPQFLAPLENITAVQGRDVVFTCVADDLGEYRVSSRHGREWKQILTSYRCSLWCSTVHRWPGSSRTQRPF